jgi:hypothetical protein
MYPACVDVMRAAAVGSSTCYDYRETNFLASKKLKSVEAQWLIVEPLNN